MIEETAKRLSQLTYTPFCVQDGELVAWITIYDDWDQTYELLSQNCVMEEWNGAFVPGMIGTYSDGVKVYRVSVKYSPMCC